MNPIDLSAPFLALPTFNAPATSGVRSTKDVMDVLAGLHLDVAFVAEVFAPFPVAGLASYSNGGAPAPAPAPGAGASTTSSTATPTTVSSPAPTTQILADAGTPVIASADGTMHVVTGPGQGASVTLTAADGTQYFYGHLDHVAADMVEGRHVRQGQTVGGVGGGAGAGDPSRLVFGLQPAGSGPVDPVPYLDRWLSQALASAQNLAEGANPGDPNKAGGGSPIYARGRVSVKRGPLATSTPFDAALSGFVVTSAAGLWWWNRRRRAREADLELDPSDDVPAGAG